MLSTLPELFTSVSHLALVVIAPVAEISPVPEYSLRVRVWFASGVYAIAIPLSNRRELSMGLFLYLREEIVTR